MKKPLLAHPNDFLDSDSNSEGKSSCCQRYQIPSDERAEASEETVEAIS